MPLGNVGPFEDWLAEGNPSSVEVLLVRDWIGRLGEDPWAWPSIPIDFMSVPPIYDVREAEAVPGTDVQVLYRHTYSTTDPVGTVDLLWVGPPREVSWPS